jgi:anti-sigma regulatory factor (Ser/Thr protein kinase)
MQRRFVRTFDSLDAIFEWVEQGFTDMAVDGALLRPVSFVIEELFTNMVKYNPDGPREILLSLESITNGVTASLVDFDSEPFDVTRAAVPDVHAPIEKREVGGLGLFLIRKMVDSLRYDYADRCSTVTFTRTTGARHV